MVEVDSINLPKILEFKLQMQVSILSHVHWKLFSLLNGITCNFPTADAK